MIFCCCFLDPDLLEMKEKKKKPKDNDVWAINYDDDGKIILFALQFHLILNEFQQNANAYVEKN